MEVINRTDDSFMAEVEKKGDYIRTELMKLPKVSKVTGKGLMIGISLIDLSSKEAAEKCLEKGVIVLTAKDKLRLLPPLNISFEEVNKGLSGLKEVLS